MMINDFNVTISGHELEYIDEEHIYLVDGVIVPSITQIVRTKDPDKYGAVSEAVLKRAADAGTAVHEAVEEYAMTGTDNGLPEVRGFRFLQKHYRFTVEAVEVPVILFDYDRKPLAAGRLDMVIRNDKGELGLADIKRTSALDKNYLAYQLNLYRKAYLMDYGKDITHLVGLHLREEVRKYVPIPIVEDLADELIYAYFNNEKGENGEK